MTTHDLIRDWRRISLRSLDGVKTPLRELFDACPGRLGRAGTVFVDYAFFLKNKGRGKEITLLRVGHNDVCLKLVSEQGGFSETPIGFILLDP